jgi:hypothetical protein
VDNDNTQKPTDRFEHTDTSDDVTQRRTKPMRLEPTDAFDCALLELAVELQDLAKAIEDNAAELIAICAHDAVMACADGNAAYQRLTQTPAITQSMLDAARLVLDERYKTLTSLLDQAEARFDDERVRHELRNHRMALQIVSGERWSPQPHAQCATGPRRA